MLVADIHHVSLNVSDTAIALGFYRDILGMAVLARPDFSFGGAWLDAGNRHQVHLIEATVPADLGQHGFVAQAGQVAQLVAGLQPVRVVAQGTVDVGLPHLFVGGRGGQPEGVVVARATPIFGKPG